MNSLLRIRLTWESLHQLCLPWKQQLLSPQLPPHLLRISQFRFSTLAFSLQPPIKFPALFMCISLSSLFLSTLLLFYLVLIVLTPCIVQKRSFNLLAFQWESPMTVAAGIKDQDIYYEISLQGRIGMFYVQVRQTAEPYFSKLKVQGLIIKIIFYYRAFDKISLFYKQYFGLDCPVQD